MPGKKNGRFCSKCEVRHSAPTGKKCRNEPVDDGNRFVGLYDELEKTDNHPDVEAKAGHSETDDFGAGSLKLGYGHGADLRRLEFKMEDRITRLESLVLSTLEELKRPKAQAGHPSGRVSEANSESSEDELFTTSRKQQPKTHRREPKYSHDCFTKEGEAVNNFNTVVLAGVRMIRQLSEAGENILPVLKHMEFVAKKSTMGSYRQEAYVSYDRAVRSRAEMEGLSAFGEIATEEVATSFCSENLYVNTGKGPSTKSRQSAKRKATKYCRAFNESVCDFKSCVYSHTCMACDDNTHGKQDCSKLKGKLSNSK